MEGGSLHDRLSAAVGKRTYRSLSDLTGVHPETVRRYMQGQAPSIEFVSAICASLKLNGDWVLTGRGPMRTDEVRREALRAADPSELLAAIAESLEAFGDRVDRLERFVQGLETRIRGSSGRIAGGDELGEPPGDVEAKAVDPHADEAASRVRSAVAKRAREDAGGADAPGEP
ncbi:MAG: helix-turn-helix domain-containing protein [Phycisphaerales bacterium]